MQPRINWSGSYEDWATSDLPEQRYFMPNDTVLSAACRTIQRRIRALHERARP